MSKDRPDTHVSSAVPDVDPATPSSVTTDPVTPALAPARVTGWRHLFAAASYSLGGLERLWNETAFRHEVVIGGLLLPVYIALGAQPMEIMIYAILFAVLIAVEALNTAIEVIVDRISPEWSDAARQAKDLGSLAVMCLLVAHGLLLFWVIFA